MALEAYIDDSGRGRGGPVFVLAGLIASEDQWGAAAQRWQDILDRPLPSDPSRKLSYFRTTEAMSLDRQFAGWTQPERDSCMLRLATIAQETALFRVRISVPKKDFNAVMRGQLAPGMDTPYIFAFWDVMIRVIGYQSENGLRAPIDFIFDDQQGGDRRLADKSWSWFGLGAPARFRHLIGKKPSFRDDKTCLPLQAADLVAWHARTALSRVRRRGEEYESEVWRVLQAIPPIDNEWTRPRMRQILRGTREFATNRGAILQYDLPMSDPRRSQKFY